MDWQKAVMFARMSPGGSVTPVMNGVLGLTGENAVQQQTTKLAKA